MAATALAPMTDTLIVLVPITAYAGKHDNHDWEYGTYIDPDDELIARVLLEQAEQAPPDQQN